MAIGWSHWESIDRSYCGWYWRKFSWSTFCAYSTPNRLLYAQLFLPIFPCIIYHLLDIFMFVQIKVENDICVIMRNCRPRSCSICNWPPAAFVSFNYLVHSFDPFVYIPPYNTQTRVLNFDLMSRLQLLILDIEIGHKLPHVYVVTIIL